MQKYTDAEITQKLLAFPNWALKNTFLRRDFVFKDHSEALGFVVRVALIAETIDHHPNWSGVYNKVTLQLKTHDADGITDKDFRFVQQVEELS